MYLACFIVTEIFGKLEEKTKIFDDWNGKK